MSQERQRTMSEMVRKHEAPLEKVTQQDLTVERLPGSNYPNPNRNNMTSGHLTDKIGYIMYDPRPKDNQNDEYPISGSKLRCQLAAPRKNLHFNPSETTFGIVTCGGICPGLNDVIRSITLAGIMQYGVKRVIGFRYGYWGLSREGSKTAMELSRTSVTQIHRFGGTILGSSRGPQDTKEMVETLVRLGVNVLFTVGGDGTQRGALKIYEEARRSGHNIGVFGIPKTIDNDLSFSHRTFGFQTAVEQACMAVRAAYAESISLNYGVGIAKLMGRESGFIAAEAALASAQANLCLVPESPMSLETVLKLVEHRFLTSRNCVIVVAEGFGQDWVKGTGGHDASGNKRLIDIGAILKKEVAKWLKKNSDRYPQADVKYIDPSYMIRACPPSSNDALFCTNLSTLAVHEAMAGSTGCVISMWYNNYILVPIKVATSVRRVIDTNSLLWQQVCSITVSLDDDANQTKQQELRRELEALTQNRDRILTDMKAKL